ncbi:unnamed protein product [Paramecium sonneborni]|uniref:Uncharacterized protein n=1 Tax=Paramecium sonneborni TaxID=65129 RepID=A0A8S1R8J5_9CILI|nr:unnamed protein product [Paramecium sonneborni]
MKQYRKIDAALILIGKSELLKTKGQFQKQKGQDIGNIINWEWIILRYLLKQEKMYFKVLQGLAELFESQNNEKIPLPNFTENNKLQDQYDFKYQKQKIKIRMLFDNNEYQSIKICQYYYN